MCPMTYDARSIFSSFQLSKPERFRHAEIPNQKTYIEYPIMRRKTLIYGCY